MNRDLTEILADDEDARLQKVLGYALWKATVDCFTYCARLRSGELVFFASAEYDGGEWISLELHPETISGDSPTTGYPHGLPVLAERGISVRLSDIVWVADAPHGS